MEIPLFPLHTVLCPGIVLPLHIFEDRYRALTRHCLDTGEPFGVVLIRDGRRGRRARATARPGRSGRTGRDPRSGPLPDGRYDLLAAATGRFAIETVDPGREPYLVADVTPLEDEVGDEARAERLSAVRHPSVRALPRADAGPRRARRARCSTSGSRWTAAGRRRRGGCRRRGEPSRTRRGHGRGPSRRPTTSRMPRPRPRADRRRDLVIPDDPTVLSYLLSGHRPARAPATPGPARGGDHGDPARVAHPPARPRGRPPRSAAAAVLAGPRFASRAPAELSGGVSPPSRAYSLKRSSFQGSASLL